MRYGELRLRSGTPEKALSVRCSRARVAWLCALGALLVSGAAPPSAPEAPARAGGGPALFREELVSSVRVGLNPELSPAERIRIAAAVVKYSARYGLDPALVLAVISRESTARPWVRSSKGAVGLMQVMPYMMGSLRVAGNIAHVESNIEAGCMILADNIRRLGEQREISAYFWGNSVRDTRYFEAVEAARAGIRREAAASQAG